MTQPLGQNSTRRLAAAQFGAELRRAMHARQVGSKTLGPQAGCAPSTIAAWLAGNNLPRLDTATRLAESLRWPKLVPLARAGRVAACEQCGREFVNEGGSPKRFCSPDCAKIASQLREPPPGRALAEAVRGELERVHGTMSAVRRRPLTRALREYNRSDSKRVTRVDRSARRLQVVQATVAAFCGSCEPEGVCRAPDCELRPVSPLPLALRPDKMGDVATKAPGLHGDPETHERWLEAQRAANGRRWARPGERETASSSMRARHAAMSPEEREAWIQSIRDAKAVQQPAKRARRRRLTDDKVEAIRRSYAEGGGRISDLAAAYGVSVRSVYRYLRFAPMTAPAASG